MVTLVYSCYAFHTVIFNIPVEKAHVKKTTECTKLHPNLCIEEYNIGYSHV